MTSRWTTGVRVRGHRSLIEGFHEALTAIAARSGASLPDLAAPQPSDGMVSIYRAEL